jgi:hypothetical protein
MRRRCRLTPTSLDLWPGHRGPQHHTLNAGDRADPQFRAVVLVDGYQQLRIGHTSAVAVTAYKLPEHPTVAAPPPDHDDFICAQWGLASADGRNEPLAWVCDITFERYPETAHQLAGRIDPVVARRMHSVDLLLVLDVPTSSIWNTDDVRLIVPNDKGLWSSWP